MAVGVAPELDITVKVPVARLLFLIILLFIFTVEKATALLMAVNAPVPALVPDMMLLPDMVSVPVPAVIAVIPVNMDAAVPAAVHPVILLPVMVTVFPDALVMPVNELIKAALPVTSPDRTLSVMDIDSSAPELIAVIGATAAVAVVIVLIVFCDMTLDPAVIDITVTAADPPDQF
jgi:hypothetical protein